MTTTGTSREDLRNLANQQSTVQLFKYIQINGSPSNPVLYTRLRSENDISQAQIIQNLYDLEKLNIVSSDWMRVEYGFTVPTNERTLETTVYLVKNSPEAKTFLSMISEKN